MATVDEMTNWSPAPGDIRLRGNEVDVWLARLDRPPSTESDCRTVLSGDERTRADRFHFERDRTAYTVARAALKTLIGKYLGLPHSDIRFQYTTHGKPYLAPAANTVGISFNISHSYGLALLSFTIGRQVGVDVERIRPDFGTLEIARRFFSTREIESLLAQPPEQQAQ